MRPAAWEKVSARKSFRNSYMAPRDASWYGGAICQERSNHRGVGIVGSANVSDKLGKGHFGIKTRCQEQRARTIVREEEAKGVPPVPQRQRLLPHICCELR